MKTGKLRKLSDGMLSFYCKGCKCHHGVYIDGEKRPIWGFNNNYESPTFIPSILVRSGNAQGPTICHSFVTDGKIQYLSDCTHELAGQTIELENEEE